MSPTLQINSSAREVSWTTAAKADSTWQAETPAASALPCPQGAVTVPCFCRRLPTESKDAHKPSCTNPTAALCYLQNKTCPWGPCEKPGCPECAPHNHSLPPEWIEAQCSQLELQVKQHLFSNVTCSKGWCGSTGVAAFKMLPTLSVKEALNWFPCPQLLFPDSCTAALPLAGAHSSQHCLQQHLSSCQQRLLTPASWGDSPNEGK